MVEIWLLEAKLCHILSSLEEFPQKKTVTVGWGVLTEAEVKTLQQKLVAGYFPLTFRDAGGMVTIESYRGTLSKVALGEVGDGIFYYKSVSCKIIQR